MHFLIFDVDIQNLMTSIKNLTILCTNEDIFSNNLPYAKFIKVSIKIFQTQ